MRYDICLRFYIYIYINKISQYFEIYRLLRTRICIEIDTREPADSASFDRFYYTYIIRLYNGTNHKDCSVVI